MRAFSTFVLLLIMFISTLAYANENRSPYIEISVNGLEEVAPPLNRLADAIEKLAESDKLSEEDQQKVIGIIGELKVVSGNLDSSIQNIKDKITQVQGEITDSIRQMILFTILGIVLIVIVIVAAVIYLFKFQISPFVNTTSTTVTNIANAIDNLSTTAELITEQGASKNKRFARKQMIIR
jgi:predicted PurR-regulated permease PerM